MDIFKDLLSRYYKLTTDRTQIITNTQKVFKNVLNLDLNDQQIKYHNGVISLKTTPLIKTEIFINKDVLIRELNQLIGSTLIKDIR